MNLFIMCQQTHDWLPGWGNAMWVVKARTCVCLHLAPSEQQARALTLGGLSVHGPQPLSVRFLIC